MAQSLTTVVRTVPQQDLMNELFFFLKGAAKREPCNPNPVDLTRSALTLLKCLPPTKTAVFEYFCGVFDNAVKSYIQGIEVFEKFS